MGTIMESKEDTVLKLFFQQPAKEWHFEEIVSAAEITRSKATLWLKKFRGEGLIRKIKKKGRMPYYLADCISPSYQNRKRLFAFQEMYQSGFLTHLSSLEKAKTIIIFGSFTRWDWYEKSDIDLFIYGDSEGLKIAPYELKLHRDIEVFVCENEADLARYGSGLLQNIFKGTTIKGDLNFVKVEVNA